VLLLVALLIALSGCRDRPDGWGKLWPSSAPADASLSASTHAEVTVEGESLGFDPDTDRFTLSAASHETVMFELRLRASAHVDQLGVRCTDLSVGDGGSALAGPELSRLHAVRVDRRPGWHIGQFAPSQWHDLVYDVVVPANAPRGGLPCAMETGEELRVLGEVVVPGNTAAGDYRGRIEVSANDAVVREIPIVVTVWPFELPALDKPLLLAEFDHANLFGHHVYPNGQPFDPSAPVGGFAVADWKPWLRTALSETVDLLRAHGLCPVGGSIRPTVHYNPEAKPSVLYSDFDEATEVILTSSASSPAAPPSTTPGFYRLPLGPDAIGSLGDRAADSVVVDSLWRDYVRDVTAHFMDRGWIGQLLLTAPPANPCTRQGGADLSEALSVVDGLTVGTDLHVQIDASSVLGPVETWRCLSLLDANTPRRIWSSPARFCDPSVAAGQGVWFKLEDPPFSGTSAIQADDCDVRVIPWQAARYQVGAVELGDVTNWPASPDHDDPQDCIAFDPRVLLYPGTPFALAHPVASMRMKWLRRGMQDLAYLELLRRNGREHVGRTVMDSLSPYALSEANDSRYGDPRRIGWVREPDLWEMARHLMADELVRAIAKTREPVLSFDASALRWRQFIERTRIVLVDAEGVRVRATRLVGEYRIECTVRIENWTRVAVEGRLTFDQLPVGWVAEEDDIVIGRIEPMTTRRRTMAVSAPNLAWGPDGTLDLPITFQADNGQSFRTSARLAYVVSARCRRPPQLDGDLTDWAPGSANVAANFLSIAGAEPGAAPSVASPADVRCVVSHDHENVYFGIHCDSPPPSGYPSSNTNVVQYDGVIPVGEDLVELLFDPLNAGTHAPEDLYHIVVKRGGVAVIERGVATSGDVLRRPWAADVRYAVKNTDRSWTIELKVPLDRFDMEAGASSIWGFNVTRFDQTTLTYDTWSGARHTAYDPASLGNLMIPADGAESGMSPHLQPRDARSRER